MKCLAITPLGTSIHAEVSILGSKSYTNRALILAALARGAVSIKNPLASDDTVAMVDCLKKLGISCSVKKGVIEVKGGIEKIKNGNYELNANLSGTTIRFILALSTIVPGVKTIRGEGRLNERPIADLVEALRAAGAQIEYVDKEGFPPLRVSSSKLSSGTIQMSGAVSSQFLSALLMIASKVGNIEIKVTGKQISKPYIDMTIDTMKKFGVTVEKKGAASYFIPPGSYALSEYIVEGDVSSASYFFAIAALTKSRITLKNMNPGSLQADMGFVRILEQMGNVVTYGPNEITIEGKGVKAMNVDMESCPDQVQTLAVLAAFAPGTTRIAGVGSLRVKETERVAALERELAKMGIQTSSTQDTLTIHGGSPKPAVIDTYWDHRMAMAFAVAGAVLPGMHIRNPDVVGKTFPDFWKKLAGLGIKTKIAKRDPNIVLIGMRGSGKTTVGKLLSKKLGKSYVDLDEYLEEKAGTTIREIVERKGWEYFRDLESKMVKEVSKHDGAVISTGGGIITRTENIEAIKKNGLCIYLDAPLEVLMKRISNDDSHRPALTNATPREEMKKLLDERKSLYEAAADETVDGGEPSAEKSVEEIIAKLKERGIVDKKATL